MNRSQILNYSFKNFQSVGQIHSTCGFYIAGTGRNEDTCEQPFQSLAIVRPTVTMASAIRGGQFGACPVLTVTSLEVRRGDIGLLRDLSFELSPGQTALVTGANGSGKTSLLRVLAGLAVPAAGRVAWRGSDVHRLPPESRGDIAYLGHLDGLKRELTVDENLSFCRSFWNGPDLIGSLTAELRLASCRDREVRRLSAGQRRRVALACMRLKPASFWLLDEPLTNLDAPGTDLAVNWLTEHTAAGGIAVVSTHRPERLAGAASIEVAL